MRVDLVYCSWNRLRYTQETFAALLERTDWERVEKLVLADDASEDGTREWLIDATRSVPVPHVFLPAPFGGPVAAVNRYLEAHRSPAAEALAKIDNDTVVPHGWLEELLGLLERHPEVDLLGMAPRHGPPRPCPYPERGIELAPWVDGNGVWRHRVFDARALPTPEGDHGRHGFTEYQFLNPEVVKAWAEPDLPVFQLDLLPIEPWLSLSAEYRQRGWQREWPNYTMDPEAAAFWEWHFEIPQEVRLRGVTL